MVLFCFCFEKERFKSLILLLFIMEREIGRRYGYGLKDLNDMGEPIIFKEEAVVYFKSNDVWIEYDTEAGLEKKINCFT